MLLTYTLLFLISLYPTPPLYHVEDMKFHLQYGVVDRTFRKFQEMLLFQSSKE